MPSRIGEFASGVQGPTETPSLMERAQKFNNQDPHKFQANGVGQPYMLSPNNGNSAGDAARQTPNGELPDSNGMSTSTYNQLDPSIGTKVI